MELKFNIHHLENGLTILTHRDPFQPLVSFQIHFKAGSRYERPGITGISHMFEHMMFKGTKKVGPEEFARIIQAAGGSLNAFTTQDNTTYYENLPSDKLELAVKLEADRLKNLRLTEETLEPEREVVRNERKLRTVNSPFGLVYEKLYALAYERHPYQWPVIGWDSDLKAFTLEDCKEYYRIYYAPNNSVIVISGDIEEEKALSLVKKYFGDIPAQKPPPPIVTFEEPQRGEKRAIFKKVSKMKAFFAGFHVPGIKDDDIYPLMVLCTIFSTGKSSRFYKKYIKKGVALEVSMDVGSPPFISMDPGLLIVEAVLSPDKDTEKIEKNIWADIEEIKRDSITNEELKRAKKQILSSFLTSMQTNFFKALLAGMYHIRAGDFSYINRIETKIKEVTIDMIVEVTKKYLTSDNRTVVTLVPISSEEHHFLGPIS